VSETPRKLGKYTIVDVAGRGNMGIVYVAHDPYTDRKVAIKVCPLDPGADSHAQRVARKLFFNEAHTAGALDHPNILKIQDAGEEAGQPYIVMEHVDGGHTLQEHINPDTLLPVETVVRLVYQAAKGLDYAHRRGVIHRDIKPGNIMLTPENIAKIGDFGIAQYALSDATQVMGVLGSPRYMSPEQAREEELTRHTDLYSLGVVAYELLTGHPPFAARGISRLVYKILNQEPAPIGALRQELPEPLEAIIARSLAKQPEQRFESGQAFAAALAALFPGVEGAAPPPDPRQRFGAARALRFFNEFSDGELREVVAAGDWLQQPAGVRIVTEGSVGDMFYVIVRGAVKVLRSGRQISTLGTGDCFGEMGYLTRGRRSATIVAREDVTLLRVGSVHIERASVHCQLRFTQVFLRTLIERLERTSERLAESIG